LRALQVHSITLASVYHLLVFSRGVARAAGAFQLGVQSRSLALPHSGCSSIPHRCFFVSLPFFFTFLPSFPTIRQFVSSSAVALLACAAGAFNHARFCLSFIRLDFAIKHSMVFHLHSFIPSFTLTGRQST
jgi:hypothetical protein